MTNPTFDVSSVVNAAAATPQTSTSSSRKSTTPGVIRSGAIKGRNGLKEAFEGVTKSTHIKDQIIRIVASDLTGLIGVLYGRYITGARISQRELTVEGLDAIRELLSLQDGEYDLLHIEREILTRKLKQSLGLDLQSILAAAQFNPTADLLELFEQQAAARLITEPVSQERTEAGLFDEIVRPANDDSVLKISLSLARELFPKPPEPSVGQADHNELKTQVQTSGTGDGAGASAVPLTISTSFITGKLADELRTAARENVQSFIPSSPVDNVHVSVAPVVDHFDGSDNAGPSIKNAVPNLIRPAVRKSSRITVEIEMPLAEKSSVPSVEAPRLQSDLTDESVEWTEVSLHGAAVVDEHAPEEKNTVGDTGADDTTRDIKEDVVLTPSLPVSSDESVLLALLQEELSKSSGTVVASSGPATELPGADSSTSSVAVADLDVMPTTTEPVAGGTKDSIASGPDAVATDLDLLLHSVQSAPVLPETDKNSVASVDAAAAETVPVGADQELSPPSEHLSETAASQVVPASQEPAVEEAVDEISKSASEPELPPVNFVLVREEEQQSNQPEVLQSSSVVGESASSNTGYDVATLNAIPTPNVNSIVATQNQKLVVLQDLEATLTRARTGTATGQFRAITSERLKPSLPEPPSPSMAPAPPRPRRTEELLKSSAQASDEKKVAGSQTYQSLRVKQQNVSGAAKYKDTTQLYLSDLQKKLNVDNRKFVETGKHRPATKPINYNLLAIATAVCVAVCFAAGFHLIMGTNESLSAANAKLAAGDFKGAASMYSRIIEKDPNSVAGYTGRAAANANLNPEDAFADYKKALQMQPQSAEIRSKYAALLLKQGHNAEALNQANLALRKDFTNADAHLVTGICQARLGNYEEAIPSLEIAYKKNVGARAEICHYLYEACLHCKRKPEAAQYIDEAIKVAPSNAQYLIERARLKVSDGDFSSAKKDLAQGIKLSPLSGEAHYLMGICNYEQRALRPAVANWTEAQNRGYNVSEIVFHRGHAYLELGQYHEALADLESYLQFEPDDKDTLRRRNFALFQSKRRMPVLASITPMPLPPKAVHFKGDAVNAGYTALRAKDSSSAITILNEAVKTNPDNPLARKYLAYAHLREGNLQSAVRQFQAWNYLQPVPTKEMWLFAKTCMTAGKYSEAAHVYGEIVKADPHNSTAKVQLIKACALSGETEKAKSMCVEAMANTKDPKEYQMYKVLMP